MAVSGRTGVRVVVVGDRGTGKSSLISTAATEAFPESVQPVLPPTRLPADFYPDRIPVTIIDTSSSLEHRAKLAEELKRADAVVLTYSCDNTNISRPITFWLHELRRLEVKAPVIVVGCKLDLRDERQRMSLEQVMSPIMQQFREIETCIECSAASLIQVPDVFYYAQKAVLHPTSPLFDQETQTLKPRCIRALKRIFILCDRDMDGALSDAELNEFQIQCFNAPLQPAEIVGVKRVVQEKLPDGVNHLGLTLSGFLFLHALFIEKGRLETTWTVLRKFGYDDAIKLSGNFLPVPSKRAPDQSVELTSESLEFLKRVFNLFDIDNTNLRFLEVKALLGNRAIYVFRPQDGALRHDDLDDLFSTAPESPWQEAPYSDAAERTAMGALSLNGFLSEWALMTVLDPASSLANLIYIGYAGDPSSALRVTRRRSFDRKKQQTERSVFQCVVFGPKNSGKSALLTSFLGRPFSANYTSTVDERYATNGIDELQGNRKTLILREIPEDRFKKFLSNKQSLAACDTAIFVYDSSDELSWRRATELLVEVARQGEETGFGVPCLLVAAKFDLDPFPMAAQESAKVCEEMGIESPIPVSVKSGDLNNLFSRILRAAEHPHISIPETETGRKQKQYRQLVNHSLMFFSVGAAVAVVGLAAYRTYAARKSTSS